MKKTLRNLQDSGLRLCLATGRGPMILPDFGGVEFDAVISFNGSYCYAGDKVIRKTPLPAAGLGVAMGNASDRVKEIADEVCGSVEEDGIATYFSR